MPLSAEKEDHLMLGSFLGYFLIYCWRERLRSNSLSKFLAQIFLFSLYMLSLLCIPSYAWLRDADIEHSSDSVRVGIAPDFSCAYEKIIDHQTSFGFSYWPLPFGGNDFQNIFSVSYNKQFFFDEGSAWAYYMGVAGADLKYSSLTSFNSTTGTFGWEYKWRGSIVPILGLSYKHQLNDQWSLRAETLYIVPYKFELAYRFSDVLEVGFSLSAFDGLINCSYLF